MPGSRAFLIIVALATVAFAWVLRPYFGAVFWAVVIAIMFHPFFERLAARLNHRRNLASFATVALVLLIVVIPLLLIAMALVEEITAIASNLQSGKTDLHQFFQQVFDKLPQWSKSVLAWLGLSDSRAVQDRAAVAVSDWVGLTASQVFSIGQSTISFFVGLFAMLYLTFFLLRDGTTLTGYVKSALPFPPELQDALFARFVVVVRATVTGDILVAMLQGGLGGLGFWLIGIHATILWTVLMAFLALMPVFGSALVWLPFAVYFLSIGAIWQGLGLLAYGALVIGLIDNFLRPYLVGQATKMPEFVVLISTLGGIATFGMQGFIIGPVVAAMFISVWSTYLTHNHP